MRTSRFSNEQIVQALRQAESGTAVADICQKLNITETTFYRWKKRFLGLDVSELRQLKALRDENRKLKQLVADLTLDKQILREALGKNGEPSPPARGGALSPGRLPRHPAPGLSGPARLPTPRLASLQAP